MTMAVDDMATAPPITAATAGAILKNKTHADGHDAGGDEHLRAADPEHFPAHCHQARQGEFQAQREYQEYHAEVRQQLGGRAPLRQVECMRTQYHPDREISENGRQFQFAHTRHHANRSGEQNQDLQ